MSNELSMNDAQQLYDRMRPHCKVFDLSNGLKQIAIAEFQLTFQNDGVVHSVHDRIRNVELYHVDKNPVDNSIRCKHNLVMITKSTKATVYFMVRYGTPTFAGDEIDTNTQRVRVECDECGLDKTYTKSNMPKWVLELLILIQKAGV